MVFEKVRKIIANHLDYFDEEIEEIKLDSEIQYELGADDLDIVEILMKCEEEFDINIPDSVFEKAQGRNELKVKDIVECINKNL